MASNLGRVFATMVEQCKPKLGISCVRTEISLNSASRLICSSTQRFQAQEQHHQQQDDIKGEEAPIQEVKIKLQSQRDVDDVGEDDPDDDDVYVNKKTGEIGGPRGPEPTRYGDWERNGRCSDF